MMYLAEPYWVACLICWVSSGPIVILGSIVAFCRILLGFICRISSGFVVFCRFSACSLYNFVLI